MKTLFNIGDKITAGDIASYIFDTIRPVAGYSLRKLSNISGPVIRARRGIDNKESDFYADEIEGGELQGFATNDGASDVFVTTWYDQFGNNNATQTTAADQPKIWDASAGLVTDNGKPAIRFNGNSELKLSGIPSSTATMFFAMNYLGDTRAMTLTYDYDINPNFYGYYIRKDTSGGIHANYGNPSLYVNSLLNNVSKTDEAYNVLSGVNDQIVRVDLYSDISAWPNLHFGKWVGGSYGFNGNLQEWLIYGGNQSANRETIETNINQYYIIFGPLRYNQRITEDSGTFALTDRYEAIYDEVTEIATPSLLCTCDAYKESTLTTYGTLYNIIPT